MPSTRQVNPGNMTSFGHCSLGVVVDWMYRTVAGLAPASPGYRSITVRPIPGGGITSARARHVSPYGPIAVAWRTADGAISFAMCARAVAGVLASAR